MLLYIDSLFGDGRQREAKPLGKTPETLGELYLQAMREHDRPAALLYGEGGRWQRFPDWRFDRHVIRVAIYLSEHLGIGTGDQVAIVSDLRPEWLLADFAALGLRAIPTAIPADLAPDELAAALREVEPAVVFTASHQLEGLETVRALLPDTDHWIVFDGAVDWEGAIEFEKLLDIGGTLDTPERAQSFRAGARETVPDDLAIRQMDLGADGAFICTELTHAEAIERLKRHWLEYPARKDDVIYVAETRLNLDLRLALYGFLGDGLSTVALGNRERSSSDVLELHPRRIADARAIREQYGGPAGSAGEQESGKSRPARLAARLRRRKRAAQAR